MDGRPTPALVADAIGSAPAKSSSDLLSKYPSLSPIPGQRNSSDQVLERAQLALRMHVPMKPSSLPPMR
jgi:hypothetical protein